MFRAAFRVSPRLWHFERARPAIHPERSWTRPFSSSITRRDDVASPTNSPASLSAPVKDKETGCIYVDSVFPIRLGSWDIRYYIAAMREEEITQSLRNILTSTSVHGYNLLKLEPPQAKDGGVYAYFEYDPTPSPPPPDASDIPGEEPPSPLEEIEMALTNEAVKQGGIPNWLGLRQGHLWAVKGKPWKEDMNRYPSKQIRVEFEGPDVHPEVLYRALRPFGRIRDISRPTPVPAGSLRSSVVTFRTIRSAVRAQSSLHGLTIPNKDGTATTRLSMVYEQTLKGHAVRDWMSSHPKIVLPVLAFLLGSLTYTIFDPIRAFFVQGKVLNWFDYRDYSVVQWVRENIINRLSIEFSSNQPTTRLPNIRGVWEEREDAKQEVNSYLSEYPSTIAFIHGPQGSGKTSMVNHILGEHDRRSLVIDCNPIYHASGEAGMISALAKQTNYWPVFSFASQLNTMIDLATMGLIGQKAGFSSSLDTQLRNVLDVVGTALKRVNESHNSSLARKMVHVQQTEERHLQEEEQRERIRRGVWHDGRLDCVAGNGVISELGVGDEVFGQWEEDPVKPSKATMEVSEEVKEKMRGEEDGVVRASEAALGVETAGEKSKPNEPKRKSKGGSGGRGDIEGLPIVVIRNYGTRSAGKHEVLLDVLSNWAAALVENQIAHVIVVSDNRENMKRLAKSLGSRPLMTVALSDADNASALNFFKSRLEEAEMPQQLSVADEKEIQRLGGRSNDLEALVYKVKNGQTVHGAVEEIIVRTMGELRKNAFGDDVEDAKGLPWKREQAWTVLKGLANKDELPYADTLLGSMFKGDDAPLREMETAELISVVTNDGLPMAIRPGRPVYRYVFERLVKDPVFHAIQEIAVNDKSIASADALVRACEDELKTLRTIGLDTGSSFWRGSGAAAQRAGYLLDKMREASEKIAKLETTNERLRKVLARNGKTAGGKPPKGYLSWA